jgi:uncharacterized protein YjiS (DUF1127 family)
MPAAKHLSFARSRSRMAPSRGIHGSSFGPPRVLPQQASQPAIAVASLACRLALNTAAQIAASGGGIFLTIASWVLRQTLVGCLAYAIAMYGMPELAFRWERGKPKSSAPLDPPRPTLPVISADTDGDIRAGEIVSLAGAAENCAGAKPAARSRQTAGGCLGWRTVIITPAAMLLSKIRQGSARHRMIAELQDLDDRSLRDIGISRADIGYLAMHGTRPK